MVKPRIKIIILCALLLIGAATSLSWKIEIHYPIEKYSIARILYLPHGRYLKMISFGFSEFQADLLYIWSIQFYGDPGIENRYDYLLSIYNVITDLNPKFIDAYRLGTLIAYYEMQGNMKIITALSDKGINHNPKNWQIPADAGYYASQLKLYKLSRNYFTIASKAPGSPPWTKRWAAEENFLLGEKDEALKFWQEALSTSTTSFEIQICKGHIHDTKVEIEIDNIKDAIELFTTFYYRPPRALEELVKTGIIQKIPVDPEGKPFFYDPETGKITPEGGWRIFHLP